MRESFQARWSRSSLDQLRTGRRSAPAQHLGGSRRPPSAASCAMTCSSSTMPSRAPGRACRARRRRDAPGCRGATATAPRRPAARGRRHTVVGAGLSIRTRPASSARSATVSPAAAKGPVGGSRSPAAWAGPSGPRARPRRAPAVRRRRALRSRLSTLGRPTRPPAGGRYPPSCSRRSTHAAPAADLTQAVYRVVFEQRF